MSLNEEELECFRRLLGKNFIIKKLYIKKKKKNPSKCKKFKISYLINYNLVKFLIEK